jgi:hypothetical protein
MIYQILIFHKGSKGVNYMEEEVKIFESFSNYEKKIIKSLMRNFSNIMI